MDFDRGMLLREQNQEGIGIGMAIRNLIKKKSTP